MKQFCTDWDEFKDTQMCHAWVATAIIGAGVLGAGASIFGASKAADAQKSAAQTASQTQLDMYGRTRADLEPFRQIGRVASDQLTGALPGLTAPINLTQDWLESTPGYQFTKTQGLKATQSAAAARGLGVSGAALKGAATFATGLADQTYKTQFDVENTNRTNTFNRLKALVDTGGNAAAMTGNAGATAATGAAGAQIGGGNAQAASYNAAGGAISSFANNIGGYAMYKGLYGDRSPTYNLDASEVTT